MLFARGKHTADYRPTCFDSLVVYFELYDPPPVTINQIKLKR